MKPTPRGWPRLSSTVFYPDPMHAIDWLCHAFGFELRLKVEGEPGKLVHSELTYGGGVVMVQGERPDMQFVAPASVGGDNTQNMFMYVDDAEAHLARARAGGATIVQEIKVSDYGEDHWADQGYTALDVGGHQWSFAQRLSTGASYTPKLDGSAFGPKPPPKGWPRIASSLYYDDPMRAIDWLCEAFGFEIQIKVEGEPGKLVHSELVYADGLVMVSDCARTPGGHYPNRRAPSAIGNANTQNLMLYVDDAKAACERARKAGAEILQEPKVSDYGEAYWADLSFGARDVGGHQWWVTERLRG